MDQYHPNSIKIDKNQQNQHIIDQFEIIDDFENIDEFFKLRKMEEEFQDQF